MITAPVDLSSFLPIDRVKAIEISSTACKFNSMITLEKDGIVLNAKSMIGLLSQSIPKDGLMTLVINGPDEQEALSELTNLIR